MSPEELVAIADQALGAGQYSTTIADLADLRTTSHPSTADTIPPFLAWLEESGLAIPSREEAMRDLLRDSIGRIVHGQIAPLDGLKKVARICDAGLLFAGSSGCTGERFGLTTLYAASSALEDLEAGPELVSVLGKSGPGAIAALSEHALALSELWWKVHGPASTIAPDSTEAFGLLRSDLQYRDLQLEAFLASHGH